MRFILSFLLLIIISCTFSQNSSCDGSRYIDDIFDDIKVTSDIKYGRNVTVGGDSINLYMDIYEPEDDYAQERPVVFILHGGGFHTGSKSGPQFVNLSKRFARKGYVAVSIDYRLYDLAPSPPDSFKMMDVIFKASVDFKAAMRFMYEDAVLTNVFKIDTNYFFAGGFSAGAVISASTAYLDDINEAPHYLKQIITMNGGLQGNSSQNLIYRPKLKGVFNASGGMMNANFIDANDPPLNSFHANGDDIMPYKRGFINLFNNPIIEMDGSFNLHHSALSNGIVSQLSTIFDSVHLSYLKDSVLYDSLINSTSRMFKNIACKDISTSIGSEIITASRKKKNEEFHISPNPAKENLTVKNITGKTRSGTINILDCKGALVIEKIFASNREIRLNIDYLNPGIYMLIIHLNNGIVERKKLIVF